MRATHAAPTSWSKRMSEMGPIRVRFRRPWRISSWPAAKGMAASSAVPMHTALPSGTKRVTASRMDMSLVSGTRPSYSGPAHDGILCSYVKGRASGGDSVKRLLPWLVAVAFFMESLDTTILNTAVPAIAKALAVAPLSMKAVLSSYTLSLAVFIPISGWMADRFGTRRVFASAIGLFTLGSVLCGLATNITMLVACRVLQGMGGAMMVPVGRMTMVRTFPKAELVRAMSFVAVPSLIGPMVGPVLGGLIVHYLHWSVVFFVNIPVGLAGLLLVWRFLPDYREDKTHPLDVVGLILFGSGIALLSYVLEVFGETSLNDLEIVGLLAVSALLLAGYGINATHNRHPLLLLGLFHLRTFRASVV